MTYKISAINHSNITEFYKGKRLEIIQDKFSSIFTNIVSVELKDSLFIEIENKTSHDLNNFLNVYDDKAHSFIKLLKINGSRKNDREMFLVKDISENKDFFRSFERNSIVDYTLSLCYKDTFNQIQYKQLKGHDISIGGISFVIKADDVHSINEYISISCEDLKLNDKRIELMNMRLVDDSFLIGTKFK